MGKEIDILKKLPHVGGAFIAQRPGQLRRFLSRYEHVNTSDSPQQVGRHSQNISQLSYGAPAQLSLVKEKLYVPQKFALGPFYHRPDSEIIKNRLIRERYADCHFEELVNNMRADGLMSKVRAWYAGLQCPSINEEDRRQKMDLYSDDADLARMMAGDGLFLLEFLRFLQKRYGLRSPSWRADEFRGVQEDVMRIVNQIPFFVLKCILQWEAVRDKDKDEANKQAANTDQVLETLLKHASLKLSPIEYDSDSHDSHVKARVPRSDSHLLEFVYEDIISSSGRRKSKSCVRDKITLPQAVKLTDKGVKFTRNTGLISDIRFVCRNGKLYLPAIKMDCKAEALLTNMVKFEAYKQGQGQGQASQPLISYVDLMERLIDNDKDVQALRDGGIIHCDLSTNKEVADVWNRMRKLLPDSNEFKYEPIDYAVNDVIRFYKSKWRPIPIQIHRRYFSNPWSGISLAAACILMGLTVFQTYVAWEQLRLQRISMHKP